MTDQTVVSNCNFHFIIYAVTSGVKCFFCFPCQKSNFRIAFFKNVSSIKDGVVVSISINTY